MQCHSWRRLAAASILILAAAAEADDRNTLLQTEQEYVAELLTLNQPALAQQHLEIIRQAFPQATEVLHYYQGRIALATQDYKTAVHNFESVLKGQPADARRDEVTRSLIDAATKLGDFARATALLAGCKPAGGQNAWYPKALVDLADAVQQGTVKRAAKERVAAKGDVARLLKQFGDACPQDPVSPWIRYFLAEFEYDRLIALLSEKGKLTEEGAPVVIEKKEDAMVVQLQATRRLFAALKAEHPTHPAIQRVEPRLKYLDQLVDKITDARKNGG